jgi:hypothetical protein
VTHAIRMLLLAVWGLGLPLGSAHSAEPLIRGVEFRKAWNNPIRARLDKEPLRLALQQFCSNSRIAWVVDRRLDPDQRLSCTPTAAAPLSEFLPELLDTIHADAVVVGDTVIVGPEEQTRWLRTLAEIQRKELLTTAGSAKLVQALGRPLDLHWDDLAQPRQLAVDLARRAKVTLTGVDLIPYDLWGSGDLVGVTAGEALTVLAWQYDLQLQWQAGGKALLVPLQLPVHVSQTFPVPEARRTAAKLQFPDLASEVDGKSVRWTGRVEELEALDRWLQGGPKPRTPLRQPAGDWRNRKYTFKVENAPLIEVLKRLQEQGIPLEWDEAALVAAGVDLRVKLQIDLKDASAAQMLSAICDPAGLKSVISARGATISPP